MPDAAPCYAIRRLIFTPRMPRHVVEFFRDDVLFTARERLSAAVDTICYAAA